MEVEEIVREDSIVDVIPELKPKWKTYDEYLESPEWKEKRTRAIIRADNRCQLCNSSHNLQVHHRTYVEGWGNESDGNLTVLCRRCHEHFTFTIQKPGTVRPKILTKRQRKELRKQRNRQRREKFASRGPKDPKVIATLERIERQRMEEREHIITSGIQCGRVHKLTRQEWQEINRRDKRHR